MDAAPDITLLATNLAQGRGRLKLALYNRVTLISAAAQTPIPQKWTPITYFLVGFPYVLFAILLVIILVSLRTVLREMTAARRLRKFYRLQEQVARQKGVFMQLAAHYLRTPLALIVAGEESLAGVDSPGLKAAVAKLSSGIESLLSRVEAVNDQTTPAYVSLKPPRPPLALKRPAFYVPISILVVAITTFYWLLHLLQVNKQVANANLLIQVALIVLLGTILYAILRSSWLLSEEHKGLKQALQDQAQLDDKRNAFIHSAVADLTARVSELAASSRQLQSKPIHEGVERLQKLLNRLGIAELLRLTPMPTTFQLFSVAGLLDNVQPVIAKASERNIGVTLPPDNTAKTRDVSALTVVVQTLLDNAISYSPDNSSVEIRTDAARGSFTFSVADHGKGISSQDKEQLFKPFTKVEGALSFEHEGAGLSLYLDQLIMTYLGGTINLESEPGHGTQTTIGLPQRE